MILSLMLMLMLIIIFIMLIRVVQLEFNKRHQLQLFQLNMSQETVTTTINSLSPYQSKFNPLMDIILLHFFFFFARAEIMNYLSLQILIIGIIHHIAQELTESI